MCDTVEPVNQLERGPQRGDAFGTALLDVMQGGDGIHIVERDDGLVEAMRASGYFDDPDAWPEPEATFLARIEGRALDIGAGAGRHSLALQHRGHQVVALDTSAGAIEVCRARGLNETFLGALDDYAGTSPGVFDAILLLGHNLGLLESAEQSEVLFSLMARLLAPGGVVIGSGMNPYLTDDPVHHAYQQQNRERGRYPGQIRLRIRHRDVAGDWFNYLFPSPEELGELAARSGWRIEDIIEPDPSYLAVLRPV